MIEEEEPIEEIERKCSGCEKSGNGVTLFNIILPPLIKERTDLCKPCLVIAIDASKKKGKALEK
jgi:hypothetical protein